MLASIRAMDVVAAWDFRARRWLRGEVVAVNRRSEQPCCTVVTAQWAAVLPLDAHWVRAIYVLPTPKSADSRAA